MRMTRRRISFFMGAKVAWWWSVFL